MPLEWFKPRKYRHFDLPVDEAFARRITDAGKVAQHNFVPLLHYTKLETRYKKDPVTKVRKIATKPRPIKYASHRDACILSYYAYQLNQKLEPHYGASDISKCVIAYRALGRSNYDFASEVLQFSRAHAPVMILAFDITSFFDNLDHGLLKQRLAALLGTPILAPDWYKIFRATTSFHYVELDALKAHAVFGERLKEKTFERIASVEELKAAGVPFLKNPAMLRGQRCGIPQGTPISATLSNVYMLDFDVAAQALCQRFGALYRRYSDDILAVCRPDDAAIIEAEITRLVKAEKLEISELKTEKTLFSGTTPVLRTSKAAQYLGFTFDESGPAIRESSMARQWRKMKRAIKRARKSAKWRLETGKTGKTYTKKLYRRFSLIAVNRSNDRYVLRNFSSYARRSAKALGPGEKVSEQVKRFERAAARALRKLKLGKPAPPALPPTSKP